MHAFFGQRLGFAPAGAAFAAALALAALAFDLLRAAEHRRNDGDDHVQHDYYAA